MAASPFQSLPKDVLLLLLDWIEALVDVGRLPAKSIIDFSSTAKDLRASLEPRMFRKLPWHRRVIKQTQVTELATTIMNRLPMPKNACELSFSLGTSSLYVSYSLPRYGPLVDAYSLLRNLNDVTMLLPRTHDTQFKKLFAELKMTAFPKTRHLRIYRTSRYILPHCPDLQMLSVDTEDHSVQGGQEAQHMALLLAEAGNLPKLWGLAYSCRHWSGLNGEHCSGQTLREIARQLPHLKELAFRIVLDSAAGELLASVRSFSRLECLALPGAYPARHSPLPSIDQLLWQLAHACPSLDEIKFFSATARWREYMRPGQHYAVKRSTGGQFWFQQL